MKIFITGGTGFIGHWVVKLLYRQGHNLLLLSRNLSPLSETSRRINFLKGDLSDIHIWKHELKKFHPEITIHLAWESLPNYDVKTSIKNLNYGLDLLTMLGELGCKSVICPGTCWEYGRTSGKLQEDMSVKPFNAFSAAKNSLHWLGDELAKEYGMTFIWTRLFFVYGPGQKESSLIPYIIHSIKQRRIPEIKNPLGKNDFIYVEDAANALCMIANKQPKTSLYNIGSGRLMSVEKIIKIMYDLYDIPYQSKNLNPALSARLAEGFYADISRIKKNLTGRQTLIF